TIAITFMLNGARDLALTQCAVEALVVVLLTAMLLGVPLLCKRTRSSKERQLDGLIALGFALTTFVAQVDMAAGREASSVSEWIGQMSLAAGYGYNVVNVILVDFRGFDTMGEVSVIAMAALLGAGLFARHPNSGQENRPERVVHYSFS